MIKLHFFITLFIINLAFLTACGGGGGGGGSDGNPGDQGEPDSSAPVISDFSPKTGTIGDRVLIEGLFFAEAPADNQVLFNGVAATIIDASRSNLLVEVPSGALSGRIRVVTSAGEDTSVDDFVVSGDVGMGAVWQTRLNAPVPGGLFNDLGWNGSYYVAVGSGCWSSDNAVVWQENRVFSCDPNRVLWDGNQFVGVGDNGGVYRSTTGQLWSGGSSSLSDPDFLDISFANNTYVAVGEGGVVYTSADGAETWTARDSGITSTLNAISWSGELFVAVGDSGTIITSTDGMTWTSQNSGTTNHLYTVKAGGNLLVTSGAFGIHPEPPTIMTSTDGATWTKRADYSVRDVAYGGGRWVGVSLGRTVVSTDGENWVEIIDNSVSPSAVIYAQDQFLSLSILGDVYRSSDGSQWQQIVTPYPLGISAQSLLEDRIIAVAGSASIVSTDNGVSWNIYLPSNVNSDAFINLIWSPRLNTFLSLVQVGANEMTYTSDNGENWQELSSAPASKGLASSADIIVNAGSSSLGVNLIYTSIDGVVWTQQTHPSTQRITDVFWTGKQFIILCDQGDIITSSNGIDWQLRDSGVSTRLTSLAATPDTIVVVGSNGVIVRSSDGGAVWQPSTSKTSFHLNDIVWTGEAFFAVGSSGLVLQSFDGVTWSKQATPYEDVLFGSDPYNLNRVLWADSNRLIVFGDKGLIASLEN